MNNCPYCVADPPLGVPEPGVEPQCIMCWDTGEMLTEQGRQELIEALPLNAPVRKG